MEKEVAEKYRSITKALIEKNKSITVMESCTGGMIASLLTDTEGSSAVFKGSFVTYSNEAKIMQGVPEDIIKTYGVYSKETAKAMADAARNTFSSDIAIGVTGTFGNIDPNNADSTPGEVHFAIATDKETKAWSETLKPQNSRHAYKYAIALLIANELLSTCNLH